MQHPTFDPIRFDGGYIQLLPYGHCIVVLDPLPEHADADLVAYQQRYVTTLDLMGHHVIVGTFGDLAAAISEAER